MYLTDARLPIDNNDVEQLMKQVAVGRKNWLFIGSVAAGERAANFLTLVSSALRNDLDVYDYVKAVLDALLAGSCDYASAASRPVGEDASRVGADLSPGRTPRSGGRQSRTRREFRRERQNQPPDSS